MDKVSTVKIESGEKRVVTFHCLAGLQTSPSITEWGNKIEYWFPPPSPPQLSALQLYLLAGSDQGCSLQEIVVLSLEVALQSHLRVRVKVGVCDAGPGNSGHKTGLCLPGQIGFLLNCGKIHVAGGVEPGKKQSQLENFLRRCRAKSAKVDSFINNHEVS